MPETTPMPWVKLYTEMLDDPKIGKLDPAIAWRFVQIIMVAGECDAEGWIVLGDRPMELPELAWRLRVATDELQRCLELLESNGLMSFQDETWLVTNFAKRQDRPQRIKREQWRARQTIRRDKVRNTVFERANGICEYCGKEISFDLFVVDHIVPVEKGGSGTDLANLAAACRSCNAVKGDNDLGSVGFINPRGVTLSNVTGDVGQRHPYRGEKRRGREEVEERRAEPAAAAEKQPEPDQVGGIYKFYETEIGKITPKISGEITAALKDYPAELIVDAILEAALHNARNWAYCLAILKRRKTGGPTERKNGKAVDYTAGIPDYDDSSVPDPPPEDLSLPAQLWSNISYQLKAEMPKAAYDKYVSGVSPGPIDGDVVTLIVESPESRAWVKSRLTSSLERMYAGLLARQVEIEYEV